MNCLGDRFTEIFKWSGHPAASLQAVRSTHSPMSGISPISSANGTKSAGGTRPREGLCQRNSASKPVSNRQFVSTTG